MTILFSVTELTLNLNNLREDASSIKFLSLNALRYNLLNFMAGINRFQRKAIYKVIEHLK
jgi:hypothetical protein